MAQEQRCGAWFSLEGDFGENDGVVRCQRPQGHPGEHREIHGPATVWWYGDERDTRTSLPSGSGE